MLPLRGRGRTGPRRAQRPGALRRRTYRSALRRATGGGRSAAPRPTREPAAAPRSVPRTAAGAAAANPARAGKPPFHILLGFFHPFLPTSVCRVTVAQGSFHGWRPGWEQRGAPRPAGPASPAQPSPRARRWRAAAAAQPQPRQPERDVSLSGNDGAGVTAAAVGQRL